MKMLKYFAYAIWLLIAILFSCKDAQWYLDKAVDKGAVLANDTTIYKYIHTQDTLVIDGDTIFTPRLDSFPYPVTTVISLPMTRQERLAIKDSMRFELKKMGKELKLLKESNKAKDDSLKQMTKQNKANQRTARNENNNDTRQERIKNRSLWWLWTLLGFAGGVVSTIYLLRFRAKLKKISDFTAL